MFLPFLFPTRLHTAPLQVLPLAAARYNDFAKDDTPLSVVILADGFYLSSGFLNVLLYWYTLPYLLPHRMNGFDDRSIVLDAEMANNQNHLSSSGAVGNNHHTPGNDSVIDIKAADPVSVYEASGIEYHQNGSSRTYPLTASPVRDNIHIRDEWTGDSATNIDDDI
jgi:hypothetical protein